MKNVSGQKEARKSSLPQHWCPLPSLCSEKLISWHPVTLSDLCWPAQWPMSCGMLLSSPYLGLRGQWERKEWMMWLDLLKIRACKGLSHVSSGGPAWKKEPKSRGRIGNLGQVPCSQGKPTLRLQVVTKRKTPLSLCKTGLCWLCLAA